MTPQPSPDQLQALRKGLRRRKVPTIRQGMRGSFDDLGAFVARQDEGGLMVEWMFKGSQKKAALFAELCSEPAREIDRLELGWLIANMFDAEAQRIMDAIGHPMEAIRESAEPRKLADDWRHWAIVKPGHMSGL